MSTSRFKTLTATLMAGSILVLGTTSRLQGQERNAGAGRVVKGTLASIDEKNSTVTVTIHSFNRTTQSSSDSDLKFELTKDAKIFQDETAVKLSELRKGFAVTIKLDGTRAASVSVDGGTARGEFHSANAERNTITVIAGRNRDRVVYHLLKTTKVVDDAGKELQIKDLRAGTPLVMTRSIEDDRTAVRVQIEAEKK